MCRNLTPWVGNVATRCDEMGSDQQRLEAFVDHQGGAPLTHTTRRTWDRDIDLLEEDPIPDWRAELVDLAADDSEWIIREVSAGVAPQRRQPTEP